MIMYEADGGDSRFNDKLLRHFGKMRVQDITGPAIREAARRLYPNASFATWNRQVITPTRAIINRAADAGHCRPIRVRQLTAKDRGINLPPPYEATAVCREWIDAFREHASNRYLAALALFMFTTATRIGEATLIEPGDLWLQQKLIFSPAVITKNGERAKIYLTNEMVIELANLPPRKERVFGYVSRHSVYGPWKTTCRRAGMEYVPPHQAGQHSFATEMITRNGKPVATTADLGRWKDRRTLHDRYAHGEGHSEAIEQVFASKLHYTDQSDSAKVLKTNGK
jgi:integrase